MTASVQRFHRDGDHFVAGFDSWARDVLRNIFTETRTLLMADMPDQIDPLAALVGMSDQASVPHDPAVARLLPAGTTDDDELAAQYRRYTDLGLRTQKINNLSTVIESLGSDNSDKGANAEKVDSHLIQVRIDHDCATAWLTSLTDVRLVLADRLGIHTDDDDYALNDLVDSASGHDPQAQRKLSMAVLYDLLAFMQDSLVDEMTQMLPDPKDKE